jgi:uncharacterized membrane protein
MDWAKWLFQARVISLPICVIGIICNTITFLVFSSKKLRSKTVNIYLMFLLASDTVVLCAKFISAIYDVIIHRVYYSGGELYINNCNYLSITLSYVKSVFTFYSVYIVVMFTLLRTIAVYSPLYIKQINSKKLTYFILLSLLVLSFGLNTRILHRLFKLKSENNMQIIHDHSSGYNSYFYFELILIFVETIGDIVYVINKNHDKLNIDDTFWEFFIIYVLMTMIIPIIIIFILNIIIIISLCKARYERNHHLERRTPNADEVTKEKKVIIYFSI